jgi:hypothetical protein
LAPAPAPPAAPTPQAGGLFGSSSAPPSFNFNTSSTSTPAYGSQRKGSAGGRRTSTYGSEETSALVTNAQAQLGRLVRQLQDCEELREDLDEREYAETRADTVAQVRL